MLKLHFKCLVTVLIPQIRDFAELEIINKITQITSIIFHNSRPRAILIIGFIKMADDNQMTAQVLLFLYSSYAKTPKPTIPENRTNW